MTFAWRQYKLVADNSTLVCWLDDASLKIGTQVTLKELPDTKWTVDAAYSAINYSPRKTWHVGGL